MLNDTVCFDLKYSFFVIGDLAINKQCSSKFRWAVVSVSIRRRPQSQKGKKEIVLRIVFHMFVDLALIIHKINQ